MTVAPGIVLFERASGYLKIGRCTRRDFSVGSLCPRKWLRTPNSRTCDGPPSRAVTTTRAPTPLRFEAAPTRRMRIEGLELPPSFL